MSYDCRFYSNLETIFQALSYKHVRQICSISRFDTLFSDTPFCNFNIRVFRVPKRIATVTWRKLLRDHHDSTEFLIFEPLQVRTLVSVVTTRSTLRIIIEFYIKFYIKFSVRKRGNRARTHFTLESPRVLTPCSCYNNIRADIASRVRFKHFTNNVARQS